MAKQEKRTFKWGDSEYLLDDLLKLHAQQENYYYNFARDKGKYDEAALVGLRNAIASRIDALKTGKVFDADGSMEGDTPDNISIAYKEKKGWRNKKLTANQDNTEWAKYYINQLVNKLNPYTGSTTTGSWDMSKYGLGAYLTGEHGMSAQEIFENKDKQDPNNPTAARGYAERHALLREKLGAYRKWLEGKQFDFTQNDNEWDDNFIASLDALIANQDWSDATALAASLRKLGAGDYTEAFTSDKWDLTKTKAESESEAAAARKSKAERDRAAAYNNTVGGYYNIYSQLDPRTAQMTAYLGEQNSNFYRTPEEIVEWGRTHKANIDAYEQRYLQNKWDVEAAQYVLPIMQSKGLLKETIIDGKKYVYDPRSIDRNNHSFIAIDPETGRMEQRFVYDIESEITSLKNKYLSPQGAARYQIEMDKEGGVLKMQSGGDLNLMEYLTQLNNEDYKKRAEEQGVDEKVLRERERTPLGDQNLLNEAGFTGNDLVQMGTAVTNIASMFMDPVLGGVVGAGSSTVDFINDWNRDGFQWGDLKNYGINLGMDALGMIPIVGDTFGTLGKVKKSLINIAPKVIGYLGMVGMLSEVPHIADSLQKIVDDRDMTTEDWQNVANGLNLIVSGTLMVKGAYKTNKAKKASIDPDKIQLYVKNKEGKSQIITLDGANAKKIKDSDGSETAVNEILHKIEGFQDYTVDAKSPWIKYDLKMPFRKDPSDPTKRIWNPFEAKPKSAVYSPYYDFDAYRKAYNESIIGKRATQRYEKFPGTSIADARAKYLYDATERVDGTGKSYLDDVLEAERQKVDADIKTLRERAKAYAERHNKVPEKLTEAIGQAEAKKSTLDQQIADARASIPEVDRLSQSITNKGDQIAAWEAEIEKLKIERTTAPTARKTLIDWQIQDLERNINNSKNLITLDTRELASAKDKVDHIPTVEVEIKKLQELLDKLNTRKSGFKAIDKDNHSHYFQQLLDFKNPKIVFNGKTYEVVPSTTHTAESLINEGIFKQGGSINRNKIFKFLNYAKR